jgi:hypothetical protein
MAALTRADFFKYEDDAKKDRKLKILEFYKSKETFELKDGANAVFKFEKSVYDKIAGLKSGDNPKDKAAYLSIVFTTTKGQKKKLTDLAKSENILEELIAAYFHLGNNYKELNLTSKAIEYFNLGFNISNRTYFIKFLAQCYENENNKNSALQYFIEYANKLKAEENSNENEEIEVAIRNTIRLAIDLDKANELPDWIKNYSRGGENK